MVTFLILIFGLLKPPFSAFIKKRRETRRVNALAKEHFKDFKNFTDRFGELLDQSRSDTITYALGELINRSQEFRNISFLSPQDLYNLFRYFKERLKRFDRTKEDFTLLVEDFGTILDLYNKLCVCKPVEEIRKLGRDKVDEPTKEEYTRRKGEYGRFIGNYIDFGKKLNDVFGERIFRDYFELPKDL